MFMTGKEKEALVKRVGRACPNPSVQVDESSVFLDMDCPHDCRERNCGNWCPLFEVIPHSTYFDVRLHCGDGMSFEVRAESVTAWTPTPQDS